MADLRASDDVRRVWRCCYVAYALYSLRRADGGGGRDGGAAHVADQADLR